MGKKIIYYYYNTSSHFQLDDAFYFFSTDKYVSAVYGYLCIKAIVNYLLFFPISHLYFTIFH